MTLNDVWDDGYKLGVADERKESKKLLEAAQIFVDRMRFLESNKIYQDVWVSYQNHGQLYNGPQYGEELAELEKVLNQYKGASNGKTS